MVQLKTHSCKRKMSLENIANKLRGTIDRPRNIPIFSVCASIYKKGLNAQVNQTEFYELCNSFPVKLSDAEISTLSNALMKNNAITLSDFTELLLVCFVIF